MTTDTQTPTTSIFAAAVESEKSRLIQILTTVGREYSFGQVLEELRSNGTPSQGLLNAFDRVSVADLLKAIGSTGDVKKGKKSKKADKGVDAIPALKNVNDPAERAQFSSDILKVLSEGGLGTSGRGFTPLEIRKMVGRGNEGQTRTMLSQMVEESSVMPTGKTKGLRYVVMAHASAAQAKAEEDAKAKAAAAAAKTAPTA